jgi:pyrroline-5-carboxylate reductase
MKKIAILGCGNMTQAIFLPIDLKGLGFEIYTYTPSFHKAHELAEIKSGKAVRALSELPECDYYFLGCKPQQFEQLAKELVMNLRSKFKVISIMAGINSKMIEQKLPGCSGVLRVMPNTPALVGHGAFTTYFFGNDWAKNEVENLNTLFLGVGEVFEVQKEEDLDFLTPINGSAPAYLFEIARILESNMEKKGFSKPFSRKLVAQTLVGACVLLKNSEDDSETLRNKVTSKGGVTAAALDVFKEANLESLIENALDAARVRNSELSKI